MYWCILPDWDSSPEQPEICKTKPFPKQMLCPIAKDAWKDGRNVVYSIAGGLENLNSWQDAIHFFSETMPLGVIGTYFPESHGSPFGFKHQYLFGALDSEILYGIAECMRDLRVHRFHGKGRRAHRIAGLVFGVVRVCPDVIASEQNDARLHGIPILTDQGQDIGQIVVPDQGAVSIIDGCLLRHFGRRRFFGFLRRFF